MVASLPRERRAQYAVDQAMAWLRGVVDALRQVEDRYAGVGGRPGEIDWYVRAKKLVFNSLHQRLASDAREGTSAMLRTLAEFEPAAWIEEEYGEGIFRLVCGKVDRLRGALLSALLRGAPLPQPSVVA
jgi:hypothetical protein